MGTRDPLRLVFHSPLHVHRSVLHCRAISLSDRSRVVGLGKTNRGGNNRRWNLLPASSAAVRVSVRVAIMMWFLLIALSPLLTYQHHVIDIVGGFVLAALCFGLFRETGFL